MNLRRALEKDIPALVELSRKKRMEYEKHQPVFWKRAKDADEKQTAFFQSQLKKENVIALVLEEGHEIKGFLIASLVPAPPVYEPGGLTCLIDDFVVAPQDWKEAGTSLLKEVQKEAAGKGAVQAAVFCGHLDESKREMLAGLGFSIATETYVKPFADKTRKP